MNPLATAGLLLLAAGVQAANDMQVRLDENVLNMALLAKQEEIDQAAIAPVSNVLSSYLEHQEVTISEFSHDPYEVLLDEQAQTLTLVIPNVHLAVAKTDFTVQTHVLGQTCKGSFWGSFDKYTVSAAMTVGAQYGRVVMDVVDDGFNIDEGSDENFHFKVRGAVCESGLWIGQALKGDLYHQFFPRIARDIANAMPEMVDQIFPDNDLALARKTRSGRTVQSHWSYEDVSIEEHSLSMTMGVSSWRHSPRVHRVVGRSSWNKGYSAGKKYAYWRIKWIVIYGSIFAGGLFFLTAMWCSLYKCWKALRAEKGDYITLKDADPEGYNPTSYTFYDDEQDSNFGDEDIA